MIKFMIEKTSGIKVKIISTGTNTHGKDIVLVDLGDRRKWHHADRFTECEPEPIGTHELYKTLGMSKEVQDDAGDV